MREQPNLQSDIVTPENTVDKYQSHDYKVNELVAIIGAPEVYKIIKLLPDQNSVEMVEQREDGKRGMRVVADIETITRQFA